MTQMANEYEKYQIPQTGVDSSTLGRPTQSRSLHEKVSNWNAPYVDARMPASQDYTRTVLSFQSKDELSDWKSVVPVWQFAEENTNPYVVGSTVKRFRDDQFFRTLMEHPSFVTGMELLGDYSAATPAYIDLPKFDVMDTKAVAGSMTYGENYPTEGWRSYGGKYDFQRVGFDWWGA
jgi:hypothetical protein